MPIYQVTGRRINDRPDPDGWRSSGTDLPLSTIDAPDIDTALDIGHQMAGKGDTPLTRTVVQAHRWVADGVEECRDSTRWWLDGAQVEPVRLTREYARDGRVLNRHPIAAARIADEVRWFTGPLGHLWLHVRLTGIDQWAIASADRRITLTKPDQRRRFTTPDDALYFAEQQAGVRITEEQAPPEDEHVRGFGDELIRSGESVADAMRRVRVDIGTEIQAEHDAGDSDSDGPDEVCDVCLRTVPSLDGGGLANRHHAFSCSLYDPSRR